MKCIVRNKCITRGSQVVELDRIFTTAILSHLNRIWELCQCEAHVAAARRIGNNSLVWIGTLHHAPYQGCCNHL